MSWGVWPAYEERKVRSRNLGFYKNGYMVTEDKEIFKPATAQEFIDFVIEHNLDLYVHNFSHFEFTKALFDRKDCVFYINGENQIMGCSIKAGRRTFWVGCSTTWGYHDVDIEFISDLRNLFNHCEIGERPAPSSLGQAIWKSTIKGKPRHLVPCENLREDLLAGMVGGRVDTFASNNKNYLRAFEIDINSAYLAAAAQGLPAGKEIMLYQEADNDNKVVMNGKINKKYKDLEAFYTKIDLEIPENMEFGVIPYRDGISHEVTYLSKKGLYKGVWAWKTEILRAIEAGCMVNSVGRAWGWDKMNLDAKIWAEKMQLLRNTAPDIHIEGLIKLSIVAALGSHGRKAETRTLCKFEEGDEIAALDDYNSDCEMVGVKIVHDMNAPNLNHWYSYIMAEVRVKLYDRMRLERANGNEILATNYDSILLTRPTLEDVYNKIMGQWKMSELTNVTIPNPRQVISDQKVRLPGVPISGRQ